MTGLLLSGCSNSIQRTSYFNPSDGDAVVVLGTKAQIPTNFSVLVSLKDPDSSPHPFPLATRFIHRHASGGLRQVSVQRVKPGDYVFTAVHTHRTVLCLAGSTFSFTLDAGKIYYLGEISMTARKDELSALTSSQSTNRSLVSFSAAGIDKARYRLADFPNIIGQIEPVDMTPARFTPSQSLRYSLLGATVELDETSDLTLCTPARPRIQPVHDDLNPTMSGDGS